MTAVLMALTLVIGFAWGAWFRTPRRGMRGRVTEIDHDLSTITVDWDRERISISTGDTLTLTSRVEGKRAT